jgi:Matrixin
MRRVRSRILHHCALALAALASTALGLNVSLPAKAWGPNPCRWYDYPLRDNITTKYTGGKSTYNYGLNVGDVNWNGAQNRINFVITSGTPQVNAVEANFGNVNYDGTTISSCSGSWFSGNVGVRWNSYHTNGYTATEKYQVITHELGHALGLAHSGYLCSVPAIMYTSSSRYWTCGWTTPQADDVDGINAMYPNGP